jgi:hypothetical protein
VIGGGRRQTVPASSAKGSRGAGGGPGLGRGRVLASETEAAMSVNRVCMIKWMSGRTKRQNGRALGGYTCSMNCGMYLYAHLHIWLARIFIDTLCL